MWGGQERDGEGGGVEVGSGWEEGDPVFLACHSLLQHSTPQYIITQHGTPYYALIQHGTPYYALIQHGTPKYLKL